MKLEETFMNHGVYILSSVLGHRRGGIHAKQKSRHLNKPPEDGFALLEEIAT